MRPVRAANPEPQKSPRPELGENWYRFAVAAVEEGELRATGGVRIVADGGAEMLAQADTLSVPGWRGADAEVPPALCEALRRAHRRGCRILSICSGAFALAAIASAENSSACLSTCGAASPTTRGR